MLVKDRSLVQKYWKTFMGIVLEIFMSLALLRVIQNARAGTDVKDLYFQNGVESMHFLENFSHEFKKESTKISIKAYRRSLSAKSWKKFNLFSIMEGMFYLSHTRYSLWKVHCGILGLRQDTNMTWKDFVSMYHGWATPFRNHQTLKENLKKTNWFNQVSQNEIFCSTATR